MKALLAVGFGLVFVSSLLAATEFVQEEVRATKGLIGGDDAKEEGKKIQGTWDLTEVVAGGKHVPPEKVKGGKATFSEGKMTLVSPGDELREFTFKLDPKAKPKAIDMTALNGGFKGKTNSGVYLVDGDILKMCMPGLPSMDRPTKLESSEGSDLVLMILKRQKR